MTILKSSDHQPHRARDAAFMREFKRRARAGLIPAETGLRDVVSLERGLSLIHILSQRRENESINRRLSSPKAQARRLDRIKRLLEADYSLNDLIGRSHYMAANGAPYHVKRHMARLARLLNDGKITEADLGAGARALITRDYTRGRRPKLQTPWYEDAKDRQPKTQAAGSAKHAFNKYDRDGLSRLGTPTAIGYRKGAAWRDTTPYLRLQFAHYTLQAINLRHIKTEESFGMLVPVNVMDRRAVSFTLNLANDVARLIASNPRRKLSQRISKALREALGQSIEYWFVLELSKGQNPYLHCHGEILLPPDEEEKARAALCAVAGEWGRSKRWKVKFCDRLAVPDEGWVHYAVKDERLVSVPMLKRMTGSSNAPVWLQDGLESASFITRRLESVAGLIYELARRHVRLTPNTIAGQTEAIAAAGAREAKAAARKERRAAKAGLSAAEMAEIDAALADLILEEVPVTPSGMSAAGVSTPEMAEIDEARAES